MVPQQAVAAVGSGHRVTGMASLRTWCASCPRYLALSDSGAGQGSVSMSLLAVTLCTLLGATTELRELFLDT